MTFKIDSVSARDRLKPRREPYWHRLSKGCYLGFRNMTGDSPGTWLARCRLDSGKQKTLALGTLDNHLPHLRFDKATALARDWFDHIGKGGSTTTATVKEACSDYVAHVLQEKGQKAANDLEGRYRLYVAHDPIHNIDLTKLTREHVMGFRRRLQATPVKINKNGETRARAKDGVNRNMTALRAALNFAFAEGKVTSDFAWREALKPIADAGTRRELYLDREQRRRFIQCAADDVAMFLRGLSVLPLRPGALAALTIADFDHRLHVLKVGKDKHGKDRKIKLPEEIASILAEAAKDKVSATPLFTRANGKAWDKDAWKWPIKAAAAAAGLPSETTAYTVRHSVITDLVHGGLDLLTVAQISGTSVAMIERHYGHLRNQVAAEALARLAL